MATRIRFGLKQCVQVYIPFGHKADCVPEPHMSAIKFVG